MTKRKPLETSEDLVQALADLFDEVEPETPEEIDAVLRECGHDPDAVAARMRALAERAIVNSPLNWRNRAQELEKERASLASFVSSLPRSPEEIVAVIKQLLSQLEGDQSKLVPAYYRNLDKASDGDLATLRDDL